MSGACYKDVRSTKSIDIYNIDIFLKLQYRYCFFIKKDFKENIRFLKISIFILIYHNHVILRGKYNQQTSFTINQVINNNYNLTREGSVTIQLHIVTQYRYTIVNEVFFE